MLCTGNNYVIKEKFSLTMLKSTIKVFYIYIYWQLCSTILGQWLDEDVLSTIRMLGI